MSEIRSMRVIAETREPQAALMPIPARIKLPAKNTQASSVAAAILAIGLTVVLLAPRNQRSGLPAAQIELPSPTISVANPFPVGLKPFDPTMPKAPSPAIAPTTARPALTYEERPVLQSPPPVESPRPIPPDGFIEPQPSSQSAAEPLDPSTQQRSMPRKVLIPIPSLSGITQQTAHGIRFQPSRFVEIQRNSLRMTAPTVSPSSAHVFTPHTQPQYCPACASAAAASGLGVLPPNAKFLPGSLLVTVGGGTPCQDGYVYQVSNLTHAGFNHLQIIGNNGQSWNLSVAPNGTASIKTSKPISHFDVLLGR